MRLYVVNTNREKVFLQATAPSKRELVNKIGGHKFTINGVQYSINDVKAMSTNDNASIAMVLGGAIGLLGGVAGVIAGGTLGGLFGNEKDKKDLQQVEQFNRSKL